MVMAEFYKASDLGEEPVQSRDRLRCMCGWVWVVVEFIRTTSRKGGLCELTHTLCFVAVFDILNLSGISSGITPKSMSKLGILHSIL